MEPKTQHGYLVLADISGYTAYLAGVELTHAHEILTELLELIVGQFKPVLTILKLEGDAVFAYAPAAKVSRGETLLELVEATYVAFRDWVGAIRRRTTCECNACRNIPSLDLKFIAHYGDFMTQTVAGIRELVGTDVNMAHRLLKNNVKEATGWRAYALFTEQTLAHMGVDPGDTIAQTEVYDLGEVRTRSLNLQARYQALTDARRILLAPEEAYIHFTHEYPVPPPIVWEWLNDPHKRGTYAFDKHTVFRAADRPAGRTDIGARNHCVHGKKVAMIETVLDWRPFDYFTVEQNYSGFVERITFRLEPTADGGTRLSVCCKGRSPAPGFLSRPVYMFFVTKLYPWTKLMDMMGQRIAEDVARERPEPVRTAEVAEPTTDLEV